MDTEQPPKFTIGQTVYYPALILGHDGAVSRCEVEKVKVTGRLCYPTEANEFILAFAKGKITKPHKPEELFPTRAEAVAKLRAKLETRIGYLNQALNNLHNK